ncbi:broad-range acid phosphatase Det1p [[Candida] jaroonii]|uniref:Broad-range acid phosphatase Det1p n=1 Tax=[Candida] jaroonii TaxID=467808 RepID=A0ACA9YFN6_9ASCO|nr:broad-range acid phosphatase Det1p [[Candida] jaroonii]
MGKPKYILLVRHGESEGNLDKTVNSVTANHLIPLTSTGHKQAQDAGKVLRQFLNQDILQCSKGQKKQSILFYTSPYKRARQTCDNIIDGIKDVDGVEYSVKEEPRMREQDFGNFQSTTEEMEKIWEERAHYGHFFFRIPHGESAADVYDRISSFNESLFRQFQNPDFPNILVLVTHGIWARVFLMKWFRWTYEEFETLRNIPHCHFLIMKRDDKQYTLKTPLKTWDDFDDDEIENNKDIDKEIRDEINFNSAFQLKSNLNDLDIQSIIQAQKKAIKNTKKDSLIKKAFEKVKGDKFEYGNQSQINSSESLGK